MWAHDMQRLVLKTSSDHAPRRPWSWHAVYYPIFTQECGLCAVQTHRAHDEK